MNKNTMYAIIAIAVVGVAGYFIYERQQSSGIDVKVDDSGVSVETH